MDLVATLSVTSTCLYSLYKTQKPRVKKFGQAADIAMEVYEDAEETFPSLESFQRQAFVEGYEMAWVIDQPSQEVQLLVRVFSNKARKRMQQNPEKNLAVIVCDMLGKEFDDVFEIDILRSEYCTLRMKPELALPFVKATLPSDPNDPYFYFAGQNFEEAHRAWTLLNEDSHWIDWLACSKDGLNIKEVGTAIAVDLPKSSTPDKHANRKEIGQIRVELFMAEALNLPNEITIQSPIKL